MKSIICPLAMAMAFAASGAIAAEDIYKSTMPDGRVLYGESPMPGAKNVRRIQGPPSSTGVSVTTAQENARKFDEGKGGVSVIPQQKQAATPPASQGTLHGPTGLPARSY